MSGSDSSEAALEQQTSLTDSHHVLLMLPLPTKCIDNTPGRGNLFLFASMVVGNSM